jgi:hypothetical protein
MIKRGAFLMEGDKGYTLRKKGSILFEYIGTDIINPNIRIASEYIRHI